MATDSNPTLRQRQLAEMLRALREAKGLTIDEAAAALRDQAPASQRWSKSKISRIELYQQHVRPAEVEQLAELYEAKPEDRAALSNLARDSKEKGWWQRFPFQAKFLPFLSFEQSALAIRQFELSLFPGLLQTPEYAKALMRTNPQTTPEVLESHIAARILRQQIITREKNPLEYHVILDEAVFRRPIGSSATMRNQVERLLHTKQRENITLQVIPFSAGHHQGIAGGFTILTLPEPFGDKCYVEGVAGAFYLEEQSDVRECTLRFGSLSAIALDPTASLEFISNILMEYE